MTENSSLDAIVNGMISRRMGRMNQLLVEKMAPVLRQFVSQELAPLRDRITDIEERMVQECVTFEAGDQSTDDDRGRGDVD